MTKQGFLRDHFAGVGVKRLTAVDAEPQSSNQHEVGTTKEMREQFLGASERRQFKAIYVWLDDDQVTRIVHGSATHYDTRKQQPQRPAEWRLYYPSNSVTEKMSEGDSLFLAMDRDERLWFMAARRGSTSEQQMLWLFGVRPRDRSFASRELTNDSTEIGFAARAVLDHLGVEVGIAGADRLGAIVGDFGAEFPSTAEFSETARRTLPGVEPRDDPDAALLAWLEHEEALFRCLERRVVEERLRQGFTDAAGVDVEGFISFSLSVQNRRKSRMGQSLEHHVAAVFSAHRVAFTRGAVTESNHRPDFLFPSVEAYRAAPVQGAPCLAMMGAKSTCKERWRQVLTEAAKIPEKHLLTLEPSISVQQTDQMQGSKLQLVVPEPIHVTYSEDQREWLWTLRGFIEHVRGLDQGLET